MTLILDFNAVHLLAKIAYRHSTVIPWLTWSFVSRGKGKVRHRIADDGPQGDQSYSCILSLTATVDRCGWSTPPHDRITPEDVPVPIGVGPMAGLEGRGKSPPATANRSLGRLVRNVVAKATELSGQ